MIAAEVAPISQDAFIRLYKGNIIPLRVVLAGLTWVLHDYFVTLEDEIRYVWTQKRSFGKFMFLWIRYYTIFLVAFDTLQIHTFAIPGVATDGMCVAAAPVTRIVGAISLWSVEIIMQVRIYALFNRSKKIAMFNGILFLASIGVFLWIMILNSLRRGQMIAFAKHLPLPGCPSINGGTEWALWIPPTVFEFILFLWVVYKACTSISAQMKLNERITLTTALIHENSLYFFSIACLLIFNNLMVIGPTKIPWFGFAPFHAAIGIVTCRMLVHLRKFTENRGYPDTNTHSQPTTTIKFVVQSDNSKLSAKKTFTSTRLTRTDVEDDTEAMPMSLLKRQSGPGGGFEGSMDDPCTSILSVSAPRAILDR